MKGTKKFLLGLLACLTVFAGALGLSACDDAESSSSVNGSSVEQSSGSNVSLGDENGSKGLSYTLLDDDTYSVTGIGSCKDTGIVIPSRYNEKAVTSIGDCAFWGCSSLTSITIPDSVTFIGEMAFYNCNNLTSASCPVFAISYIPKTNVQMLVLTSGDSIGYRAFASFDKLKSVVIPDDITSISDDAFMGCNSLISITVHEDNAAYKSISGNLYNKDGTTLLQYASGKAATSFTIPDGVTFIDSHAFYNCSNLTNIVIPDSVTSIDNEAFSGCGGLTSVTCPAPIISDIPKDNLQTVVIASGDTIGDSAFYGCDRLTSVTIGNSVTSIGNEAFMGCTALTSIVVPDSVTYIGYQAFRDCTGLTKITLPFVGGSKEDKNRFVHIFGHSGEFDDYSNYTYDYMPASLKEVTITGGDISELAFSGCKDLTRVTLGDGVTSIGGLAFHSSKILGVAIPSSVTSISGDAFLASNCSNIYITDIAAWCNISFGGEDSFPYDANVYLNNELVTKLEIPNTVTEIKPYAFSGWDGLTSVTIPDSVTAIDYGAFSDCDKLVEVVNKSPYITIEKGSEDNGHVGYYALAVYNSGDTFVSKLSNDNGHIVYTDGKEKLLLGYTGIETDLILPSYITKIYQYAFYYCDSLTSIEIPDSVASIGEYAFYYCDSLTSVEIPNSVTSIGSHVFQYCDSLTSVTMGNGVTSIGDRAFYDCDNLTSMVIGNSVTSIGDEAFYSCDSLTSIEIPDGVTSIGEDAFQYCDSLTSVTIGDGVASIGDRAFYYCSSLTSVVISDSVTSIGGWAFAYCSSLTSVEIPDGVTSIGDRVFSNCDNLTSMVIGNSVTSIGDGAFYSCDSLTSIEIPDGVTSIGEDAFRGCNNLTSITCPAFALSYIQTSKLQTVVITSGESIDDNAFNGCSGLKSITIPDSVTSIGDRAFYSCDSLTSVVIGNSVTSIGDEAFMGCSGLTEIHYNAKECAGLSFNNYVFYDAGTSGAGITVTIGANVKKIPARLFYPYLSSSNAPKIIRVVFEEGSVCESIGDYAFYNCEDLTSITFNGTKAQWNAISKGSMWNYRVDAEKVVCSDGEAAL